MAAPIAPKAKEEVTEVERLVVVVVVVVVASRVVVCVTVRF
jgi:hypothetical protein